MKRTAAALAAIIAICTHGFAQVGNEWINFGQDYYKIPVAKEGIYRLSYSDLQAAGFPVNQNPKNIQLFHRGVQQNIFVSGESDNQFDPGDYLEFFGQRNDGTLDSLLYHPSSSQPHKYYNLFNDTTAYFLTIGSGNGKRMPFFSEANSGQPKETFQYNSQLRVITNDYSLGETFNEYIERSGFDKTEGWTGSQVRPGQSLDYTLSGIINGVTSAGKPIVEILTVGRAGSAHQFEILAGPNSSSLRLVGSLSFFGYNTLKSQLTLEWSDVGGDGVVTLRLRDVSGSVSLSYCKVTYPQNYQLSNTDKLMVLPPNPSGKSYLEIENATANTFLYDVSDPDGVIRIGSSGTTTRASIINDTDVARTIFVSVSPLTPSLKQIQFRQITPAQHNYLIISNKILMKPGGAYSDPVSAYGAYRASAAGGSYDTLIMEMDQLYDQFSYGEITALSIHNFMKFMVDGGNPKYLFLIGKGMDTWWNYHRTPNSYTTYRDLVPTPGMPASDMYYTAGLGGSSDYPAVATGRIPANTATQVAAYLDKVKEMEARPYNELWRKNLLHLSGGIEEGEPELFKSYVQEFADVAEDYYLGGKVNAIAKRTTNPVELINISDQVNSGISLVTFFGHSSASTIDFDIGYVTDPIMDYHNKGKYPMFLINGCQAGSYFSNFGSFGEDWINAADRGAVGFIAHTSYGLLSSLKYYSDTFYEVAFGDSTFINRGVGDVQKEVARRYLAVQGNSVFSTTQVQQMVLLGDPAAKIFGGDKPDYEINNNNLFLESLDGGEFNAQTDSFALNIIVRNFGRAKRDTLSVQVKRTLNDNSVIVYDSLFSSVLYTDTLTFIIRKGHENAFGNNSFTVKVDADDQIDELDETNNTATLGLFIPLNSTHNLFPYNFAIVNQQQIELSYQSTNLLSGERNFLVEVDTVDSFDSPYKKQFQRTTNVYDKQSLNLLTNDSLTYYWRTKLADPLPEESDEWTVSSFTYIDQGQEGWAQVHFPQFLGNESEGLVIDGATRRFSFQESVTPVSITTFGSANPALNTDVKVKIAGVEYNITDQGWYCRYNTINFIAFDRRSTVPYVGLAFKWFNRAGRECGRAPWVINSFAYSQMVTGNNDDLIQYVDNINNGDSVVIFSIANAQFSAWPAAAKNKLGELGVSVAQIDALQDGEPVVIYARKGAPAGTATVYRATNSPANQQELVVEKTITGRYMSGTMKTPAIGPAQQWNQLVNRSNGIEPQDNVTVDVIGVSNTGEESVLISDAATDQDLSGIDAAEYPYLKLIYKAEDDINLTAAQLDEWLVLFEPVADGLLFYQGPIESVTVPEGVTFLAKYGFTNISNKIFSDSLAVRYEVFNTSNRSLDQMNFKIAPPVSGDTTFFTVPVNTLGKSGLNDLNVFVNPKILPEQYYDNNVLELLDYLNVQKDSFKPVLDVTFDGRHLLDNDFVSPNPSIDIRLWDENPFVVKTDTVGMNVYLQYPCDTEDCLYERIDFTRDDILWKPAGDTSDFHIMFSPQNLEPGTYRLRVEGADVYGNASAANPYLIAFRVVDEASLTILPPYPNPSDDVVAFRFIVTGSEDVQQCELLVTDLSGKEMHTIKIVNPFSAGTNELIWNGRDASGAQLPSGLYLYRIKIKSGSLTAERNGKVVIIR